MNASRIKRPVSRLSRVIATLSALVSTAIIASPSSGAIIYESGTLGATGVSFSDLGSNASVPGINVNPSAFAGVRFELSQTVSVSRIGGHFVQRLAGDFFGAIVQLQHKTDFPDSFDLMTSDLLGKTTINFPNPSAEVFGDLRLSLPPGWYALVFGSGLFGTAGSGGAVRNGQDVGSPVYIGYQPGVGWLNLADISDAVRFENHRFIIEGIIIPEPRTATLALAVGLSLALQNRFDVIRRKRSY